MKLEIGEWRNRGSLWIEIFIGERGGEGYSRVWYAKDSRGSIVGGKSK